MMTPVDSSECHPLSLTRAVADYPIGNIPLREHQRAAMEGIGGESHPNAWLDAGEVADFAAGGGGWLKDGEGWFWRGSARGRRKRRRGGRF